MHDHINSLYAPTLFAKLILQYGLLTLRLLGKLGGKNREFLREPMLLSEQPKSNMSTLEVQCSWAKTDGDHESTDSFVLSVPLFRCLRLLKLIAHTRQRATHFEPTEPGKAGSKVKEWADCDKLCC